MHPALKRVVDAYRPLHHHGLLRDGLVPPRREAAVDTPRRRGLLIALIGLLHSNPTHRSKR